MRAKWLSAQPIREAFSSGMLSCHGRTVHTRLFFPLKITTRSPLITRFPHRVFPHPSTSGISPAGYRPPQSLTVKSGEKRSSLYLSGSLVGIVSTLERITILLGAFVHQAGWPSRYFSILACRVGLEIPRSRAAWERFPPVSSRASPMSRAATWSRQ